MKLKFGIVVLMYFSFLVSTQAQTDTLITQDDYFQQDVNYVINVKLNDVSHELSAYEEITYKNNSRSELTFLYFHIWPNAYKNNKTALAKQLLEDGETKMYYAKDSELGYIDSLDFKVNGEKIKWEYDAENIDICKLFLASPLKPGTSITITTPFHVKLPSALLSRLGHIDQAYMITQWYPKPAVYDVNGWNQMPYLNQGEFYSEFGSFDVSITLPKNYVLAATGDRIDETGEEEKFLENKFAETVEKVKRYEEGGNVSFILDMSFPPSDKELKTVRFKQYNVHDFAWFADKRFNVLQGEVNLPKTQRMVKTWALFTNKNLGVWRKSREYLNDATFFYSLWNGEYQYNHVTAIDGTISAGGGMEYPNITVIGDAQSDFTLETVIMHEVGHNWFYGMLGSNERVNAWMDEGINSFNELRYIKTKYPGYTIAAMFGRDSTFSLGGVNKFKQAAQYELLYKFSAFQNLDQPCQLHSSKYTSINYGAIVYSKTAVLFNYLMNYMGEAAFDKAMSFYFDNFKFKHPQPKDLRKTLEYFSGKDLSWFFDDLIGTTKKLDYKITKAKKNKEGLYEITLKNVGEVKGPVAICGLYKGQIKAMMWLDGFDGKQTVGYPPVQVDEFRIDYFQFMPDINRTNDRMKAKGIFKRIEPIRFPFAIAIDDPYQNQLFWAPAVGYNNYNGFMAGLALYNHAVFPKKVEYELTPLYDFTNKTMAGYANVNVNLHPKKWFQQITIGTKAARFAYNDEPFILSFNKIAPYITVDFKKKNLRNTTSHSLTYRTVMLYNDSYKWALSPTDSTSYIAKPTQTFKIIHDISLKVNNKRAIDPYDITTNFQQIENMSKVAVTANYYVSVAKNKNIHFRLFAGKIFNPPAYNPYLFRMSGQTGAQDYMYDNIYFGRNAMLPNIGAQQFTETDGAFKVFTPLGQSDNWTCALNIKSPKIFKLPLYVYGDIGMYNTTGLKAPELLYSLGVGVPLAKDLIEIYFPILNSTNITDVQKLNGITRYVDTIRFTFYLNRSNPFYLLKNNSFF